MAHARRALRSKHAGFLQRRSVLRGLTLPTALDEAAAAFGLHSQAARQTKQRHRHVSDRLPTKEFGNRQRETDGVAQIDKRATEEPLPARQCKAGSNLSLGTMSRNPAREDHLRVG